MRTTKQTPIQLCAEGWQHAGEAWLCLLPHTGCPAVHSAYSPTSEINGNGWKAEPANKPAAELMDSAAALLTYLVAHVGSALLHFVSP